MKRIKHGQTDQDTMHVQFRVAGNRALFSDPVFRVGGERASYMVPTEEALIGITSSIYWKPSIRWIIDKVCVLNRIAMESVSVKPRNFINGWNVSGKQRAKEASSKPLNTLSSFAYLQEPAYNVYAHFEFSKDPLYANDHNVLKHYNMFAQSLRHGGRFDVFLGTRECPAYVTDIQEDEESYYKEFKDPMDLGFMFNRFVYPTYPDNLISDAPIGKTIMHVVMNQGDIDFEELRDSGHARTDYFSERK
ncbi:type I-C CRISPR-associated protein Cas5c [Schleiferilactobacillus harbinensis]|uniref:Type I-C CRISPR-associated protein Cas5c n=1 Tax=Schleiferilactobacillus harbinensis TaxID=304207 RepID=A0ABU7T2B7_9LACO